jgi:hypothetical protein
MGPRTPAVGFPSRTMYPSLSHVKKLGYHSLHVPVQVEYLG